jgi:phage-related protein
MTNKVELEFVGQGDRLIREMNSVDNAMDRTSKKTKGMSDNMKTALGAGAAAFAGMAAVGIKKVLDLNKSIDAMDVKAKTVFAEQLPSMQKWANGLKEAFGTSQREVVNMAAGLADLLKPMGFTGQQAAEMSRKMIDLSGALSRWTGGQRSAAEVSDILSAAMLGERDALQGLGISISALEIESRLAQKGQEKLTGAALAQAEAIATQELILEKSTDAQKAWANGGKEAAEAQNGAASRMQETWEKLAQSAAPIIEGIMEKLTEFLDWAAKNQEIVIALAAITAGIWLLNAALNANPIVLVISLIAAMVAAIIYLWNTNEGFRNAIKVAWEAIKNTIQTVGGIIGAVVNAIAGAWNWLWGIATDVFGGISRAIGAVVGAIKGVIDWVGNLIGKMKEALGLGSSVGNFRGGGIGAKLGAKRHHTGTVIPGMVGEETLVLAQAGERISSIGQGPGSSGTTVTFAGDIDGAFATVFQKLVRNGDIVIGV